MLQHAAASRPPFSELVARLESLLSSLRADVLRPVSPTPRTPTHADDYKRTYTMRPAGIGDSFSRDCIAHYRGRFTAL